METLEIILDWLVLVAVGYGGFGCGGFRFCGYWDWVFGSGGVFCGVDWFTFKPFAGRFIGNLRAGGGFLGGRVLVGTCCGFGLGFMGGNMGSNGWFCGYLVGACFGSGLWFMGGCMGLGFRV